MTKSRADIKEALIEHHFLPDPSVLADSETPSEKDTPLWIRIIQSFGAWLSAAFVLVMLGTLLLNSIFRFRDPEAWFIIGLLLSFPTALLLHTLTTSKQSDFLYQLFLSFHFAGLAAIAIAVSWNGPLQWMTWIGVLYTALLSIFIRNFVIQRLSAFLCLGFILFALSEWMLNPYWIPVTWAIGLFGMTAERYWIGMPHGKALQAFIEGAIIVSFVGVFSTFEISSRDVIPYLYVPITALNIITALWLARSELNNITYFASLFLCFIVLGITWQEPALGMGALLTVTYFLRGHTFEMLSSGAIVVFAVTRFYYDLQTTLWSKSILMISGGAFLLIVAALLSRARKANP